MNSMQNPDLQYPRSITTPTPQSCLQTPQRTIRRVAACKASRIGHWYLRQARVALAPHPTAHAVFHRFEVLANP
jgi:hypothetical protein